MAMNAVSATTPGHAPGAAIAASTGRVHNGVPARSNLVISPHHYADNEHVIVGLERQGAA